MRGHTSPSGLSVARGPLTKGYIDKVLRVDNANLIGYWPMDEPAGTVSYDMSPEANNGAYTTATLGSEGIGDGRSCPLFDKTNDFNDIYSAGLNADFNNAEGTFMVWVKVSAAGVWEDGVIRYTGLISADGNNFVGIRKSSTNERLDWLYNGASTLDVVAQTGNTSTDWMCLALTYSHVGGDELKAYKAGAQVGSTQTGLGTWSGALSSSDCCIGSASTGPGNVWDGWLAHAALWKTPLSAAQIAELAVVV